MQNTVCLQNLHTCGHVSEPQSLQNASSFLTFRLHCRASTLRVASRPTSFLSFHRCRRPSSPSKGCRSLSVSEFSHSQRTSDSSHSASGIWLKSHWVQPMATAADRKGFVQTLRRGARSHEVPLVADRVASQEFCKFLPLEI